MGVPDGVSDGDTYVAFLLRMWREDDIGNRWRASLECVGNGRRMGFPDLEMLFRYLQQETTERCQAAIGVAGTEEEET